MFHLDRELESWVYCVLSVGQNPLIEIEMCAKLKVWFQIYLCLQKIDSSNCWQLHKNPLPQRGGKLGLLSTLVGQLK